MISKPDRLLRRRGKYLPGGPGSPGSPYRNPPKDNEKKY
jgi:hypothetical protein